MISTDSLLIQATIFHQDYTVIETTLLVDSISPLNMKELNKIEVLSLVDPTKGVILNGRMPIWLAAYLSHEFHAVCWFAMNDPRLGAVVTQSHNPVVNVGQVIGWKDEKS